MPGVGSNPNWPDLRVFVDFTNPGANSTYTWTDITQWCRRLGNGQLAHIERGRNYERAQTDSGTCNIIVDNSTGVFDPENTASPYYPNVKPIRKIKVEAAWQMSNMLSAAASSFEDGTTGGWNGFAGCSVTNSIAIAHSPTHSLAVTIPGANVNNFVAYSPYETQMSVVGRTYTASLWVWSNTTFTGAVKFQHDNAAGSAAISSDFGTSTVVAANTWTQLTVTGVIPAGGGRDRVELNVTSNAAGQVIYIDDAVISGYGIYPLFQGRVEDWPRTWTKSGFYGEVVITARGILASLSTITLDCAWLEESLLLSPDSVYRMNDASNSGQAGNVSSISQPYGTFMYGDSRLGGTTLENASGEFGGPAGSDNLIGDPTSSLALVPARISGTNNDAGNPAGYALKLASGGVGSFLPAGGGWTLEIWTQSTGNSTTSGSVANSSSVIFQQLDLNNRAQLTVELLAQTSNYTVDCYIRNNAGASVASVFNGSAPAITDGLWHQIVVTLGSDNKTLTLYLDGTSLGSSVAAAPIAWDPPYRTVVGGSFTTGNLGGNFFFQGNVKNLAIYHAVLSGGQITNLFNAGKGFPGLDTGAQIAKMLTYAPYTLVNLDSGNSILGTMQLEGKNVVSAMEEANDTEVGTLWETSDGYVRFTNRHGRGGTAALAAFGEAGFPYEDGITLQQDPREIFTNVIVNRDNGVTINNTDVTATGDFFPRTLTIASRDNTNAQAVDLSNYQLNRYKVPRTRIPNLTLRPSANPALWPQVLGRDIGDRVTVTRNNPGAPSISGDFYIEKITHDISVGEWKTTWMLSSASLFDYWILGDATFSVLGSTTQLSF